MSMKIIIQLNNACARLTKRYKSIKEITSVEWNVVHDYVKLMEPIAQSLDKLQGEKNVTIGSALPCLYYIKNDLGQCELKTKQSTNSKVQAIGNDMQRALKNAFTKRFQQFLTFDETNRELILASISHPVYKLKWIDDERNIATAKRFFEEEIRSMESAPVLNDIEEYNDNEEDEFVSKNVLSSTRRSSTDNGWATEAFNFLEDRRKNLEILDQYPLVGKVFLKFNTTLSSSAPIERLFSKALIIFTPRRNRITHSNFEKTLLLKTNKSIFDN